MQDARRERFESEVMPHLHAAYRSAMRLARREDDAKDLVQESVLRAYRSFDGYTPGTNARAWLLKIVYSVFVNRYRREQRSPVALTIEELEARHPQALAAPSAAPSEHGRGATFAGPEVEAALGELPEAFRAAVMLVDVEELSYEEAAAALECPVGTLRSRLHRARRVLAAALEDYGRRTGQLSRKGGAA